MEVNVNEPAKVTFVVDTAFFIQLKGIESNNEYYTTKLVVGEIRDEKAREHYELNKDFIKVLNPSKESMKIIIEFCKKSNDLFNLSITDLSVLALGYELGKGISTIKSSIRSEPKEWTVKKREKKKPKEEVVADEEGFVEVKSKKKAQEDIEAEDLWKDFEDVADKEESSWINSDNLETKLSKFKKYEDVTTKPNPGGIYIISDDYTIQNVCLKMGMLPISVNGLIVKRVKNFLFKCYTCGHFNFDTTVLFCQECGYNTLMKIGFSVNELGEGIIYDKDPEPRVRGVQFDLPKPELGKKATVYILCEDQLPKKRDLDVEKHLDKILDNYDQYKDLIKSKKVSQFAEGQTSKNLEWGYPKKNPNIPKKYYGKKSKK